MEDSLEGRQEKRIWGISVRRNERIDFRRPVKRMEKLGRKLWE